MTDRREQQVYEEAAALWLALYGEPPPPRLDGPTLLDMITRGLPEMDYGRLASPHLRPTSITGRGAR